MKINASSYLLFAIFFLTGGVWGYFYSMPDEFNHQAVITLESSLPIETQLFYDTGKGFNENESIRKLVYHANSPVTLLFELSGLNIRGLRFDPSRSPARLKIHGIVIKYQDSKPYAVPLDSLTAVNDIKSIHYDGTTLIVETTKAARDPILHLNQIGPAPKPESAAPVLTRLSYIAAGAFMALGMAFFILWAYRNSLNAKESLGGQI